MAESIAKADIRTLDRRNSMDKQPIGVEGCSIKKTFEYYTYVWKHKFCVFRECLRLKVPIIQALTHDNSKFSTKEFGGYLHWFHDVQGTLFNGGYTWEFTKHEELKADFDAAWNNHIHNNPHHWQYWLIEDRAISMPENFVREMVADWAGFSICKTGKNDVSTWYPQQRMNLHPRTRGTVEALLATHYGFIPSPKYTDKDGNIWTVSNQCINPGWWVIHNGSVYTGQEAPCKSREDANALLIAHAEKEGFKPYEKVSMVNH